LFLDFFFRSAQGMARNPWLALPLLVLLAALALQGVVFPLLPAWIQSTFATLGGFLTPAYVAWWVGWSQEAAVGRRVLPRDVGDTLAQNAPGVYLVLFAFSVLGALLGSVGLGLLSVLIPVVLGPWVDLACLGELRWDGVGLWLRRPQYWLVVGIGLGMYGILAAALDLMGLGMVGTLAGAVGVFVVWTWLWGVRALVLSQGTWSRRARQWLGRW
jgi:hypothetical protein